MLIDQKNNVDLITFTAFEGIFKKALQKGASYFSIYEAFK